MKRLVIFFLLGLGMLFFPRPTISVSMSIVTVTAYGGHAKWVTTASGQSVREGIVAVSRDVERALNLDFGDRVLLHGLGVFEFQDRMSNRLRKKVDIFMKTTKKARRFGVRRHVVLVKLA